MENKRKKIFLSMAFVLAIPVLVAGQVSFWRGISPKANADDAASAVVDQSAIDDTQGSISDLQDKLKKEQKAKEKLQQNLGQIQGAVASTQKVINVTKSVIDETASNISRKEAEMKNLNDKIELQKSVLRGLLQQVYYNQNQPVLNVVFTSANFADAFSNTDHLLTIEDRLSNISADIADTKAQVEDDKAQLALEKQKHEQILSDKVEQKNGLVADQLDVQDNIQEKEATIQELQDKLNKLKSDLSSLLGTVVSTNDVKEAAGIAANATGVRKAFILAELTQESGLGRFTGGCTYKNTRVKPADATVFKQIMKELGYDINSRKISCAGKIGYGGAMGIAQFMPTTWTGYKSYISGATGHNPPDPWSVIDGVMGMAKKLANGGATSKSGEKAASMRYYCGTSTPTNASIKAACTRYAANVQSLAAGYEKNN
ncbi:MAG: hypothetical protein PHW24_03125 [Candidatus Moranbacteria bacterium]|nr:hypothetical protein [Candidatus Moranbacteria bacterium]